MQLTRFERKIIAAIAAVAFVPLVGALLLGQGALREAYGVGVNERVQEQLDNALELYRTHFIALRRDAQRTADAIALSHRLRTVLTAGEAAGLEAELERDLGRYSNVAKVVVRREDGEPLATVQRADRLDETRMRSLVLQREIRGPEGGDFHVEVTVATPSGPFLDYQRAGEIAEVYGRLEAGAGYVSTFYLVVYIAFLLSVIVAAMAVGVVLSRRVTRRVADLAQATERVGAGDLSVSVPTDTRDEVGELTRAFNEMVRDLRESRERIDYLQRIGAWQEFARRLAHEIKNPLTPIRLAVQEIHQAYDGGEPSYQHKLDDAKAIVEEEVATLRRLVGEFSAFAKLPEAELAPADLSDFLADFERSRALQTETLDPGTVVGFEIPTEGLPVRIDAMMLKRGVDNLVENALDAVRGSPNPRVLVSARRRGGRAILEVRDSGSGINHKNRGRVFDPYFTTKAEGTGLGLAIVKKVVLEHNGEIACEEAPEGGAAFRIELPLHSRGGGQPTA